MYVKEMKYRLPKREYKYLISVVNPHEVTIDEAIDIFDEIIWSSKRNKKAMVIIDELKKFKRITDEKKRSKHNKHPSKSDEEGCEGNIETDD